MEAKYLKIVACLDCPKYVDEIRNNLEKRNSSFPPTVSRAFSQQYLIFCIKQEIVDRETRFRVVSPPFFSRHKAKIQYLECLLSCLQVSAPIVCINMDLFEIHIIDDEPIETAEKTERLKSLKPTFQKVQNFLESKPDHHFLFYVKEHKEHYHFFLKVYCESKSRTVYQNRTFFDDDSYFKFSPVVYLILKHFRWKARREALLVASRFQNGFFFHVLKLVALFL
jgi:hypothetical protein